ncbi:MAG TPA: hypothetical protein VH105_02495 [Burkholderiales bacterium]|jgi:hypothetical protein|nr:hypothetical protein [Burkholderiales bacterium]
MATRKYNRKPVDVRELGGTLGFLLSAFADEIKRSGMPADPVALFHNLVHASLENMQTGQRPPAFEDRELHLGLVDGIHGYMHARGDHVHGHAPEAPAE